MIIGLERVKYMATCKDYFFRLLARRDYSANELLKKGREKGFEETEINETIKEMQEKDYQSDSRLVLSLIVSSQGKYGKSAVKRKCLEKGISSNLFEQLWQEQVEETDEGETSELGNLKAKVMRKYHIDTFQRMEPKTKTKLLNYLNYRGFNSFQVLQQWQQEEDE